MLSLTDWKLGVRITDGMGKINGVANDDIVISGMSGRFPESDNIEEFAKNLFDGVDMVTIDDRRWTPGLHDVPNRSGKLKDLTHFDASFFGVHAKQAHLMDPQLRLLLEITHEAFVDAGINPAELRGSHTGCFVGVTTSESEEIWTADPDKINGYEVPGCCLAMFSNRISYAFDLKGPSFAINAACSSSMFALVQAVAAIRAGECDTAIVGGVHLCLKPTITLNFLRLGTVSADGRCAAFDASASGYVRSEAAVVLLLQRRPNARRIYATVRGAGVNTDGYKEEGITFPIGDMQYQLTSEIYEQNHLRPQDVLYIEAHGTATKVGDPQEVNAIADFFCKDRKTPLLLGSVKSNMGHSEPASGLCSIVKVLIAMERGIIPGNLHYKSPNTNIPALIDGRIKVVDRNTPWDGGLVGVNSFGFGGTNAHVVLESESGMLGPACKVYSLPRLVLASGRTTSAVRALLTHASTHATDFGLHALFDAVHAQDIPGHTHRGYVLLSEDPVDEIVEIDNNEPRPIWFVFSGMESQSPYIARTLMRVPVFAASVQRSAAILQPYGVDLLHSLTNAPESAFKNVITSIVAIVAVQVALIDVLHAVGIRPDGIIGFSAGELGCAYEDEILTAEQTILAAYWYGRSILDAKLPPGSMAVVDMTWKQCVSRCPSEIVLACHNSNDNPITISGPDPSVEKFVSELTAEGIFAHHINSTGIAFNSKYVTAAAPLLKTHLETLIPSPKMRSERWISSSQPTEQGDSEIAKLCDAQYFVNNLLSPVRFMEALRLVPKEALLVEVSPHMQLQEILKLALPSAVHIGLVHRENPDSSLHLLAALGKIYCSGAQLKTGVLYPSLPWPVPRGTPGLASHVLWDHSMEWSVANFNAATHSGENIIKFDLSKPDDTFFAGHEIDGRIVFPPTGYIILIWRTIAKIHNRKLEDTAICMDSLQFSREMTVFRDKSLHFSVNILKVTGEFCVCEDGNVIFSGKVRLTENAASERLSIDTPVTAKGSELLPMTTDDIYKELRLRGYKYDGVFRGIKSADAFVTVGELNWNDNWIAFMDTMLQFQTISNDTRELLLPIFIEHVVIDPLIHLAAAEKSDTLIIRRCKDINLISSCGIEFRGVRLSPILQRFNLQPLPKLEKYVFRPYNNVNIENRNTFQSKQKALTVSLQLVLENAGTFRIKMTEAALDRPAEALLTPHVLHILETEPQVRVKCTLTARTITPAYNEAVQHLGVKVIMKNVINSPPDYFCHLVLAAHVIAQYREDELAQLTVALADTGMLLLEEPHGVLGESIATQMVERANLVLVSRQAAEDCDYVLLKRRPELPDERIVIEIDEDDKFCWVEELRVAMKRAESEPLRLYVVSRLADSGVLGLAKCLQTEPGGYAVRVFHLPQACEPFSSTSPTYASQLQNDLAVNVLRYGVWGTYRHVLLDNISTQHQVEHAYANTLVSGDFSSLRWIESSLQFACNQKGPAHTELCHVYYAPLNFRDVMLVSGKSRFKLPSHLARQEITPGLEFSGRTLSGKRVMGVVAAQGLATTVIADKKFLWDVPKTWSLEQAATVPRAYATAYYALVVRGHIKSGETVLVHKGEIGVGQAAITIALHAGCRVFTTTDTPDKRAFLRENFPELDDAVIGNSHDGSFEQMVRQQTQGRGVDLVLNSLVGDKLLASVRCLAEGGRFMNLSKLDIPNKAALDMEVFLKNTTFHCISLDALLKPGEENLDKEAVARCMSAALTDGIVKPLPSTVFTENQLEQSFRHMATGNATARVLIRIREEEEATDVCPSTKLVTAKSQTYFHPAKSYILVGGLGGVGLELGQWLVNRGAMRLVFNSRVGVRTGYQAWRIRCWQSAGVRVLVSLADATNPGGARALLREANALGPVGGVFNLAAVARNALLENQTPAYFKTVSKPKVNGTRALDLVTREMAPELDYFVVFSSIASGRGSPGLTNYGFANSAMERICEQRQADGLPGLAIQWGAIGEVGMVIDIRGNDNDLVDGTVPQRITSCMEALDVLLAQPHPVTSCIVLDKTYRTGKKTQRDIVAVVANILGIKDPSKVSETLSLIEFGMDSLMADEIKQTVEQSHDLILDVKEIRSLTFAKLRDVASDTRDA